MSETVHTQPGVLELNQYEDHMTLLLRGVIDSRLRVEAGAAFASIMLHRLPVHLVARQTVITDPSAMAFLVQLVSECNQAGMPVSVDVRDGSIRNVLLELGLMQAA